MANHNIRVRATERDDPDLRRLARALIDLAIHQNQHENQNSDDDTATGSSSEGHDPTTAVAQVKTNAVDDLEQPRAA